MLYSFLILCITTVLRKIYEAKNSQHIETNYVLLLNKNSSCNYLQGHQDSQVFLFHQLDLLVPRKHKKTSLQNGFQNSMAKQRDIALIYISWCCSTHVVGQLNLKERWVTQLTGKGHCHFHLNTTGYTYLPVGPVIRLLQEDQFHPVMERKHQWGN